MSCASKEREKNKENVTISTWAFLIKSGLDLNHPQNHAITPQLAVEVHTSVIEPFTNDFASEYWQ